MIYRVTFVWSSECSCFSESAGSFLSEDIQKEESGIQSGKKNQWFLVNQEEAVAVSGELPNSHGSALKSSSRCGWDPKVGTSHLPA